MSAPMFETLIDSRRDRKAFWRTQTVLVAVGIHAIVLSVILVQNYLDVPPIHEIPAPVIFAHFAPPPPPPPPAHAEPARKPPPRIDLVEPTRIPDIVEAAALPPPDLQPEPVGVSGGVEGGVLGGVLDAVAESAGPLAIGGDVSAPIEVQRIPPDYPALARAAGIQGVVVVMAVIRRDGTVGDVKVVRGLGMGLSEAAVEAVKKWRYEPARQNGVPVDVYMTVAVQFRLR
jgi:periplasmic protein TonB